MRTKVNSMSSPIIDNECVAASLVVHAVLGLIDETRHSSRLLGRNHSDTARLL